MEFCETCRNMLYLRTADAEPEDDAPRAPPRLVWYCKAPDCGFERPADADGALRITHTSYAADTDAFQHHVNPYLRHDPALPRIRDEALRCPACAGAGPAPDVLYIKYHAADLRYFYCCEACGHCDKREAFARDPKKEDQE